MGEELDKLTALASDAGVDMGKALDEMKSSIVDEILPYVKTGQENLFAKINEMKEGLPSLIQSSAETAVAQAVAEFQKRLEEGAGAEAGGAGAAGAGLGGDKRGGIDSFLSRMTPDTLLEAIRLFKSPSDQAAIMSQMKFGMQWMTLGQKLAKGGAQGIDVMKAIDETFGQTETGSK